MIRKKSPSAVAIASLVAIPAMAQTATKGTEQKRPCYKLWAEDRVPSIWPRRRRAGRLGLVGLASTTSRAGRRPVSALMGEKKRDSATTSLGCKTTCGRRHIARRKTRLSTEDAENDL